MPPNWPRIIHVTSLVLGGVGVVLAYLNDMQAAGVVSIAIVTVNAIGTYLAPATPAP